MTRDRVMGIINNLSTYRGRAEHLKTHIAELELKAKQAREDAIDALASPKAQVISDMPHGGGRTESAVEMLAIRLADGMSVDEYERECLNVAKQARRELEIVEIIIGYADAWLDALNDRERFVVVHQMVHREPWSDVESEYAKTYGLLDRRQLKNIKWRAIEHIMQIVSNSVQYSSDIGTI